MDKEKLLKDLIALDVNELMIKASDACDKEDVDKVEELVKVRNAVYTIIKYLTPNCEIGSES